MKFIILIIFIFVFQNIRSQTADLTVIVTNIKNYDGNIKVTLYKKENFLNSAKANKTEWIKIEKLAKKCVFKDLPCGEYAITVFHDENSDENLNRFLMFPKEGTGFSNNYHPKMKPNFEDCKIEVLQNKTEIIKLEY